MDLSAMRGVFDHRGPFATVYFEARTPEEDSAKQVELRWRNLASSLADQGADEKAIAALEQEIGPDRPGFVADAGRVLVASGDGVLFDDTVDAVSGEGDIATWGPGPDLGRFVREQGAALRLLLVVADREGGDVHQLVVTPDDGSRELAAEKVEGTAAESVHKPREGGVSHKHMQRRHEEAAFRNAADVVRHVRSVASRFRPDALVLAGEVQGRQAVRTELSSELADGAIEVDVGGRAAGASDESLDQELSAIAERLSSERAQQALGRLREGKGHGTGAEGLLPVLEAARSGAVDTLVLVRGVDVPGELYVGSAPEQISTDPANLRELSDTEPTAQPAEQALLRAVASMGGSVEVVASDAGLEGGVGAVLRFPTGS